MAGLDKGDSRELLKNVQELKECSLWYRRYYIRYLQPWNHERLVDPDAEKYWLPVDLYVGEHPLQPICTAACAVHRILEQSSDSPDET